MARISLMPKMFMEKRIIARVHGAARRNVRWLSMTETLRAGPAILAYMQANQARMTALIRQLVECESPTDDSAAVDRCTDLIADAAAPFARPRKVRGGRFGK